MPKLSLNHQTDSDAGFSDHDVLVIVFSREEVESGLTGKAVGRLMLLSDNIQWVNKFNGKVLFTFSGYENDPRELHQIPQVVSFFREVNKAWSFWFHFIDRRSELVAILLFLLVDVEVVRHKAGMVGCEIKDLQQFQHTIYALFGSMNIMHESFGLPDSVNMRISKEINNALMRLLH